MALRFIAFDRWGNQLGDITDIRAAEWTEEINGEDTLSVDTTYPLAKGNRVVWCDKTGTWHEHTVSIVTQSHDDGDVIYLATCENSISELYGDFISDKRPENTTASTALGIALAPTRWTVGEVTVATSNSTNFYRQNCRESVQNIVECWGGELSTSITTSGVEVTARKVNLTRRGSDNGRRFSYGKDMADIRRIFETDDVVTALYGYGKGEEVGDGFGRGIDFSSINNGKEFVEDAEALAAWGRPDGKGGKAHVFGKVEFSDCEDKAELLKLTKAEHEKRKVPKVSYEASVKVFADYGYDFADVGIGDDVALIDQDFTPEVRVKGRVVKIVRDLLDDGKASDIAIGNIIDNAADMIAGQYAELQSLNNRATSWDVAAYTPSAYINQIMDGLNAEFDAGASYIYQSPAQGIIIGSVPLDPTSGKPSRTPASAIQLKGGGFRIANKLKSDGSWNWRTFGTGDGFVADEIVAGILKGGSTYFDLNTGSIEVKSSINGELVRVILDAASGLSIYGGKNGKNLIGGLQVVDGKVSLTAETLKKPGYQSYITVGGLSGDGIQATEFCSKKWHTSSPHEDGSTIPALAIVPLYSTSTDGHLSNEAFLLKRKTAFTLGESGSRFGFRGVESDPYIPTSLSVDPPYFWVDDKNGGGLLINDDRYIYLDDSHFLVGWKKNSSMWMNDEGFFVNCGGKGFGFENGKFRDYIKYAE